MRHGKLSIGVLAALAASAQSVAPPAFEAASLKPSQPGMRVMPSVSSNPGRWSCVNCPLFAIFTHAFAVFEYQIDAPLQRVDQPAAPPPPGPDLDREGYPNVPGGTGIRVANGRTVYEAVQEQLGLQLRPAKRAVEMIVIDSVDRTPVEN